MLNLSQVNDSDESRQDKTEILDSKEAKGQLPSYFQRLYKRNQVTGRLNQFFKCNLCDKTFF